MNKELTELLEKLATKLGTTAEYLWKVLIVQAKIDAIMSLLFIISVYVIGVILGILHKKFLKVIPNNKYDRNTYEESEVISVVMCILFVGWVIMFLVHLFSYQNMINGFYNPEYWALKRILDN